MESGTSRRLRSANGTLEEITRDAMHRPLSFTSTGPSGETLWSSGTYLYDGAGNITAIGEQAYTYDVSVNQRRFTGQLLVERRATGRAPHAQSASPKSSGSG